ncbi:MAG: hypothetical protein AAGA48_09485 [Myxococcota bacterium]
MHKTGWTNRWAPVARAVAPLGLVWLALGTPSPAFAEEEEPLIANHLLETYFSDAAFEEAFEGIVGSEVTVGEWTLTAIVSDWDLSIAVTAMAPDDSSISWSLTLIDDFLRDAIAIRGDAAAALVGDCLGEDLRDVGSVDDLLHGEGPCAGLVSGGGGDSGGASGGGAGGSSSGGGMFGQPLAEAAAVLQPDCDELNVVANDSEKSLSDLANEVLAWVEAQRQRREQEQRIRELEESLLEDGYSQDPNAPTIPPPADTMPEPFDDAPPDPPDYPSWTPDWLRRLGEIGKRFNIRRDEVSVDLQPSEPGARHRIRAFLRDNVEAPHDGPLISPQDRTGLGSPPLGSAGGILGPLCGPANDAESVRDCVGQGVDCYERMSSPAAWLPEGGCLIVPGEADQPTLWCFGSEGEMSGPEVDGQVEDDNILNDAFESFDGPTPLDLALEILQEYGIDPGIAE